MLDGLVVIFFRVVEEEFQRGLLALADEVNGLLSGLGETYSVETEGRSSVFEQHLNDISVSCHRSDVQGCVSSH